MTTAYSRPPVGVSYAITQGQPMEVPRGYLQRQNLDYQLQSRTDLHWRQLCVHSTMMLNGRCPGHGTGLSRQTSAQRNHVQGLRHDFQTSGLERGVSVHRAASTVPV